MTDKNPEQSKQDVQKAQPRGALSPFGGPDLFSDFGFFKEMDRFFEEYLPRRWQQFRLGAPERFAGHGLMPFAGKTPSIDILDREADFLIKAELPGVDKKDIAITITNNVLTIEASMSKEEKEEKEEYYHREICHGTYRRTLELPAPVKEGEAKATFTNGVLELIVPKMEKAKKSTIKVE
ncbi:heat shock protein Hsp20 [Desulfobulbus propionicus DSM 2032]|jgi:HSP20 family protein|uniref:Heat shock protein Hsp20 n=1 Tax=Desulfobulbus propionicus (strain ATCC 33891 / DSM 2032 / VKM B-1956 / 1pr3) TaxID=577650 RepID=A0A7U3YL25_DESPD|nr:Hsp20/alpha crystallin family protein [Desulfobulbus propionicus]ADW17357.1 heat shock protein Hsp20 [Desulfobulbus propionicus DSM 2032]